MSLTPAKMKFVNIVILDRDVRRVTTALGKLGVLELVKVTPESTAARITLTDRRGDLAQCRTLLAALDAIREKVGLAALPAGGEDSYAPLDVVAQEIAALEGRVNPLLELRAKVASESEEIQDELARFEALAAVGVPLPRLLESPFLHFAVGSIKTTDLARLSEKARRNIILLSRPGQGERHNLLALTSRKGRFALETQLKQHNFVKEDISRFSTGTPTAIVEELYKRVDQIRAEQERISKELKDIARTQAQKVAAMDRRLRLELALVEASMNFGRTSSTCLITGWLPDDQVAAASSRLLQETEGRLFVQARGPEEPGVPAGEVPVLLKNHPWIRPFELLVTGFGLPRYGEVQPTALLAVSFLVMYGFMFGDVGQGAVLAIVGFLMRKRSRSPQVRDLGAIICCAGLAATAFGFLYGSVFGNEMLPALWLSPLEAPMKLIAIPVMLGIVLISVGILVNIANRFRFGEYFRGITDRFGVAGIVLYWGAIGLGLRSALSGTGAPGLLLVVGLIFVPLLIIFLRELIYESFIHKGHESEGPFVALMNGAVEVMETLMGLLANTVSFARVGAFALAHAALCMAIFSLVGVVREWPGGVVWSGAVIVLGNAVIIALEGLVVFVQDLRLEYYEFFSKFFEGVGKKYTPFRIG